MKYLIVFTTCFGLLMQMHTQATAQGTDPSAPVLSDTEKDALDGILEQIDSVKANLTQIQAAAQDPANNITQEMSDCIDHMVNSMDPLKAILIKVSVGIVLTRVEIIKLKYILHLFIYDVRVLQIYVEIHVWLVNIVVIINVIIVFVFHIIRIIVIIVIDKDPHFLMNIEGSQEPICFDFDGEDNDVIQLLQDYGTDVTVNGQLFKPETEDKHCYFSAFAVMVGEDLVYANRTHVLLNNEVIEWRTKDMFDGKDVDIYSHQNSMMEVDIRNAGISVILAKHTKKDFDYLGIYLEQVEGLSERAHGLIGQFKHKYVNVEGDLKAHDSIGELTYPLCPNRKPVEVTPSSRSNYASKKRVTCWLAQDEGEGLVDGNHEDYFTPNQNLFYKDLIPNLRKFLSAGGC